MRPYMFKERKLTGFHGKHDDTFLLSPNNGKLDDFLLCCGSNLDTFVGHPLLITFCSRVKERRGKEIYDGPTSANNPMTKLKKHYPE